MNNLFKDKVYYRLNLLIALAFILAFSACSKDELLEVEEQNEDIKEEQVDDLFTLRTTPVVGGVYIIENQKSGRTLDVSNASNSNNANVQIWGTNTSSAPTHRQWEVISVGNGYVRLKGVDSGKTLQTGTGTNNGTTVNQYSYADKNWQEWKIISRGNNLFSLENRHSGKSLRAEGSNNGSDVGIWRWKNWSSQKWYFHQVGGTDSNPPSGGSGTANNIIGSGWKLNGYTGNLNVGSNDNGLDYADDSSTSESHFFFERNGYAAFRTYAGNPTSGGSSNPRTELRERIGGGSGNGYWNGNTNTEHSMKMKFRVEDLPPSGKLAFMQIHERNDTYDDVIRVQVQGNSGQNSGSVDLRILGYVTEEITGSGQTVNFNMNMDTEYYFELTMKNGVVKLYNLNNSGNRTQTLFQSEDIGNADENYFKAGCYLQSTSSSHSGSNVYGQVLIKNLSVNPDN
jgi:hypothetical protein